MDQAQGLAHSECLACVNLGRFDGGRLLHLGLRPGEVLTRDRVADLAALGVVAHYTLRGVDLEREVARDRDPHGQAGSGLPRHGAGMVGRVADGLLARRHVVLPDLEVVRATDDLGALGGSTTTGPC